MHKRDLYAQFRKSKNLLIFFFIILILVGCKTQIKQNNLSNSFYLKSAALCGLQLDEACEFLGCTEDELEIAEERDGYTDYYLPDQTPPWEVGKEGSVEFIFTVLQEDGYVARVWCRIIDSTHSLADEEAVRAFYSLLVTEDAKMDEAFGPDGFMALTNGKFERLDDQETFFERYPDAESFLDAYPQAGELVSGRAEWLAEGETSVWLQFDWTADEQMSRFTWNYQTERFVVKQMGWEDYSYAE